MTVSRRTTFGMAALLALTAIVRNGSVGAEAADKGLPVQAVYELFTSQGCSSCPPADMLFHSLRNEPGILALSLPVTIWDHLGWKDTLAQKGFSGRQKGYSHARGDRQIYTPQAVVNGVSHCVGSDRKALETTRRESVTHPGVLALRPELVRAASGWSVKVPVSPLGATFHPAGPGEVGTKDAAHVHAGAVVLVTYSRETTVEIGKGENGGRTMRYGNVVRSISRIGAYTGAEAAYTLPPDLRTDAREGFAVLIQAGSEKQPGAVIGAVESPRE